MTPTGHRILVKPDPPPATSASDLIILPQDADHVPVSGTVVSLGPGGCLVRYQARQRAIRDCAEIVESTLTQFGNLAALLVVRDEIAGMIGTSDPVRELHVGDRVVFPAECGLAVNEDGADYIILNEDDVAAVESMEAAA